MLIPTRGIVFHTIKFSETSIITKIYTAAFGLQSYLVNGVRRSGHGNSFSLFQAFNILDLVIYKRENKNLQRLKEYRLGYIYKTLPFDIAKSSIALFLMEVLNIVVKEEEKNERMFDFIEQSIIALDSNTNSDANFHLKFLIELTGYLGFSPSYANKKSKQFFDLKEGGFVEEIPQHPYFLNQRESLLFDLLLSDHQEIMATRNERNSVLGKILQYYELHLPGWKKVNSHKILHEVLRPED